MEFVSSVREAVVNLLSAKLRSFLAILGVLVGTGSVVALISSSQLATAHALAQFKTLGTNLVSVYVSSDSGYGGAAKQNTPSFKLADVPALEASSSQITMVAPYTSVFQSMYFGSTNLNGQIIGVTNSFMPIAKVELEKGRFVSYLDHRSLFCDVGSKLAKKIESMGDNPLGNQIRVGVNMFTIVGILKPWPENMFITADINNGILVPIETSYLLGSDTKISNILIRLVKNPNLTSVKADIKKFFSERMPSSKVNFNSPEELINLIAKSRATYTMLLIAIGSISLVVGGIGVMNIMLVSVIERRREIGIRMAIGARQSDVLRMFLIESIMLSLFGGILGIIFGVFVSFILALFSHWQFYLYGAPIVLGFAVSVVVGILSGFYPALRASKLDPIQAMNM